MNGAGIMNLPTGVGGMASQDGLDSFAPLIASQQAARDIGYPQFTRELLSAGSEVDQAEVQEFLQAIREADLTPSEVATMRRVVETVLNDPNNYPEVRDRLLGEGVPEDLLPEAFDLEFFMAMRIAVEEAENLSREPRPMGPEMPMAMAEGGIVGLPQMQPIARELAAMGRNGDTMLAHITPEEAMMLRQMGGSGTINPYTGLPEFFLKKLGRALKKFAKSTVGRIVISVALGAFLGPAAAGFLGVSSAAGVAAVSGAIGGFGSSLLAGDGLKASLRNGIRGAALAYAGTALLGGSEALAARPEIEAAYNAQGASQLEKFTGTVKQTARNYFGAPTDTARQMYGTPPKETITSGVPDAQTMLSRAGDLPSVTYDSFGNIVAEVSPINPAAGPVTTPIPPANAPFAPVTSADGTTTAFLGRAPVDPATNLPPQITYRSSVPSYEMPPSFADAQQQAQAIQQARAATANTPLGIEGSGAAADTLSGPYPKTFGQRISDVYSEYLSPSRASIQPPSLSEAVTKVRADAAQAGLKLTDAEVLARADKLITSQTPGVFAKYAPLAATGALALEATTGGISNLFKPIEGEGGMSLEDYNRQREEEATAFRQQRPEFFGGFVRGPYDRPFYRAANGSGPGGVENFPRKIGAINGPGTATSDSIPAMLSDGEFVFTAKAVRNMGNGSRRKGAARMYKMMKMLEGGPVGKRG